MTMLDLQIELANRGVLGAHLSMVGGNFSIVAVTATLDAEGQGETLESAARKLLTRLPVTARVDGHA